jgi:hypothetical protein
MNVDEQITRETMQLCLALVLADLSYSAFTQLPNEAIERLAASAGVALKDIAAAVGQLGRIQKARSAVMARMVSGQGGKAS